MWTVGVAGLNKTLENRASDIRIWNEALPGKIELTLLRTRDERSALLADFLHGLAGLASKVAVRESEGEPGEIPSIRLWESWTFHMVPEAKELDPFLNLLSAASTGDAAGLPEAVGKMLEGVAGPSLVDIYVSTQCPNCPAVMDRLCRFPLANPRIHVRATDGMLFRERALENTVRAVPTVFLGDGQRFAGQVRPEEVAEGLIHGDPSLMSAEVFGRMIRAGDASGLAEMMLKRNRVFPGVVELLASDVFSLRLGAMVAMEEVGEAAPRLALDSLEDLWARMEGAPVPAQGDMVYLIGEFGDAAWMGRLEKLLRREPSPELREAVEEALSMLRQKTEE